MNDRPLSFADDQSGVVSSSINSNTHPSSTPKQHASALKSFEATEIVPVFDFK